MANVHNNNVVSAAYQGFKNVVTDARILDGNVIIGANGQAMKVDYGFWKRLAGREKAAAKRVARPDESQHARESLFNAIKDSQNALNAIRTGRNLPRIDLRQIADELGVVLDGEMNVIEGRAATTALSRLELSHLLDNLEGGSTANERRLASRTLTINGAHYSQKQIKTMLEGVQDLLLAAPGNLSKREIKAYVKEYTDDLDRAAEHPQQPVSDRLKSLFSYVKGDIFGANRKFVNLSLKSVAERFRAEILARRPAGEAVGNAAMNQLRDIFSDGLDPYAATGNEGARRGNDLLSQAQQTLIASYKNLPEANRNVITVAPPNVNEAGGVANAAQAATDADRVRAFFADLILNEDVTQAVNDGIGNQTDRLKNVVRNHMAAFRLLRDSLGTDREEALFAQLKNVVGEDFTRAFKSILGRIADGTNEAMVANFGALAQWARLEDMIDVGLSRNMFQKGWSGCMGRADIGLDFKNLAQHLGFPVHADNEDEIEALIERAPSADDDLRACTLRLAWFLSEGEGEGSNVNNQASRPRTMAAVKALKSRPDGVAMLTKIAKQMFARAVAANCELIGAGGQGKLGANEEMLLARITESLGSMSETKMRKMFAAWLRSSKGPTAPGGELLKGADPSIIKLLQGCKPPKGAGDAKDLNVEQKQYRDTLLEITSKMPKMSETELKASLYPVYTKLGEKMAKEGKTLRGITVDRVLGSASVAQAMKCTLTFRSAGADKDETKTVIIKLIKGDSEQIFKKEKAEIANSLNSQNQSADRKLEVPTVSFVRSVTEEFDLKRELINMLQGMATYGESTEGKQFKVDFTSRGGLKQTIGTPKHISSVKPTFLGTVNADKVIAEINEARRKTSLMNFEGETDEAVVAAKRQKEFESELLKIAERNCLLCESNCIIMEDAGASPLDDTLKEMTKRIEDANVEHSLRDDKADREKLLKMKSSLLELSAEMSRGLFSGNLRMFHGDFNGGNLMYNPVDNTIKVIDYGKGMSLSSVEAEAIKKMFTALTTGFQRGNGEKVIDAYKTVIRAEIERVKLQRPAPGQAGDVDQADSTLQEKELAFLEDTLQRLNSDEGVAALRKAVEDTVLRRRQSDLTSLGKIGSGRTGDCQGASEVMEDFRICLQDQGLATPLPLFDFFGSMGKIGKSIAVIDTELAILNGRLGETDAKSAKIGELQTVVNELRDMQNAREFNVTIDVGNTIKFGNVTIAKGKQSIYSGPLKGVNINPITDDDKEKAAQLQRLDVLGDDLAKGLLDDYALDVKSLGSARRMSEEDYRKTVNAELERVRKEKEETIRTSPQANDYAKNRAAMVVYMTASKQREIYQSQYEELERQVRVYTDAITKRTGELMKQRTVTTGDGNTVPADPERIQILLGEIKNWHKRFVLTEERYAEQTAMSQLAPLHAELTQLLTIQVDCQTQVIEEMLQDLSKESENQEKLPEAQQAMADRAKACVRDILEQMKGEGGWLNQVSEDAQHVRDQIDAFNKVLDDPSSTYSTLRDPRSNMLAALADQRKLLVAENSDVVKSVLSEEIDRMAVANSELKGLVLLKWKSVDEMLTKGLDTPTDLRAWVSQNKLGGTWGANAYGYRNFYSLDNSSPILKKEVLDQLMDGEIKNQSNQFVENCVTNYWSNCATNLEKLRTPFDFSNEESGGSLLPERFYGDEAKEIAKFLTFGLGNLEQKDKDKVRAWFGNQPQDVRDYARNMRQKLFAKALAEATQEFNAACQEAVRLEVIKDNESTTLDGYESESQFSLEQRRAADRFLTAKANKENLEALEKKNNLDNGNEIDEFEVHAVLQVLLEMDAQAQQLTDEASVMSHELGTEQAAELKPREGASMAQLIQERYAGELRESDYRVLGQEGDEIADKVQVRQRLVDKLGTVVADIQYWNPVDVDSEHDTGTEKAEKSRILELQAIERSIRAELKRQGVNNVDENDLRTQVRRAWSEHFASVYITEEHRQKITNDSNFDLANSDLIHTIGIVAYEEETKALAQRRKLKKAIEGQ